MAIDVVPAGQILHLAKDGAVGLPAAAEEQQHGENHGHDDPG